MANMYCSQGNATGSEKSINQEAMDLKIRNIPFNQQELLQLRKRYSAYNDRSDGGKDGIPVAECLTMSEFCGNKLAASLLEAHADAESRTVHFKQFVEVVTLLSSRTSVEVKKNYLFQLVDVYHTGVLTHDEMFRLYKLLFRGAITDDCILDLVTQSLQHPDLDRSGEINMNDFFKMIPDKEIIGRLTVDFLLKTRTI